MPKSFDELTFTDDWMFQKVMHNPEVCAELIERLLHIRVDHVEFPELEKAIAPYYTSKGVRLDVYLKDSDKIIDIECQANLKPELGKRIRYYQSMIDVDNLMKGEEYEQLKESYILFICKEDPFRDERDNHYELPCYTFKNTCIENNSIKLDDKTIKVLYNASAYEKEEDPLIRSFLHFISTNEPGEDAFSKRLSKLVADYKEDEKSRSDYLAMNLHDHDIRYEALAEGLEQGSRQKAVEDALMLIHEYKETPEVAAQKMKAPLELVLEALNQKK